MLSRLGTEALLAGAAFRMQVMLQQQLGYPWIAQVAPLKKSYGKSP